MKKVCFVSLLSPFLVILSGCDKPKSLEVEKMAAPVKASSIVIDVGEKLAILHEATPGQTLEWRPNSTKTPNFWVEFLGPSPCANGTLVLSGSATKAASCVAGNAAGGSGTITYSYYILATPPPPLPQSGATDDRIGRCVGCNN